MIGMLMQTRGKRISTDLVQIDRTQASCTILGSDPPLAPDVYRNVIL